MTYTSLAAIVLSAATLVSTASAAPLGNLVHLHPHSVTTDERVTVKLYNKESIFRDIKVDGHSYTVLPHHFVSVTAPIGTIVYADSNTGHQHSGDVLLAVTPSNNQTQVVLD